MRIVEVRIVLQLIRQNSQKRVIAKYSIQRGYDQIEEDLDEGESCFSDIQTNLLDYNEGYDQWWKSNFQKNSNTGYDQGKSLKNLQRNRIRIYNGEWILIF